VDDVQARGMAIKTTDFSLLVEEICTLFPFENDIKIRKKDIHSNLENTKIWLIILCRTFPLLHEDLVTTRPENYIRNIKRLS